MMILLLYSQRSSMKKAILILFISTRLVAQAPLYEENIVILKFSKVQETGIADDNILTLEELAVGLSIDLCIKMFENIPDAQESKYLKNIYKIKLKGDYDIQHIANRLGNFSNVVYATPAYVGQPFEIPNDTFAAIGSLQTHLSVIKAYDAWEINKGDTSVVVGILDGPIDYNHEDLLQNLQVNEADPINQIDDDGNGYVDDYYGYDFADLDNDPTPKDSAVSHGMKVAGISSAVTNNIIGVAGTGYNSRFVTLKVTPDNNDKTIRNGYEAIVYAANRGLDVINLSWGSAGFFSRYQQDIIDYAALEKNVIIVAAAGNTNAELEFYPASYENVLSVGASTLTDEKATSATYSYKIDLMAPGEQIYTTEHVNRYVATGFGSSFAAPQVAGAAAIVKHHFSNYNAKQVMERLRVTADNIDNVAGNSAFAGKLGNGRLNMFRALRDPQRPSVRFEKITFASPVKDQFFFGDTISFHGTFTNYLEATSRGTVSLSSLSQYVTLLESRFDLDQLITGQSISNNDQPFRIVLDADTPPGERISLRLDYNDETGYQDFEYILLYTAPSYLNISSGDLSLDISSTGKIGRDDDEQISKSLNFKGKSMINSVGLVVGNHVDTLFDNAVHTKNTGVFNNDFVNRKGIKYYEHPLMDQYAYAEFSTAGQLSQDLLFEQSVLSVAEDSNYILLQYRIVNNSSQAFDSASLGLLVDFDIGESDSDSSSYDMSQNLGYTYGFPDGSSSPVYAGVISLGEQPTHFSTIDFNSIGGTSNTIEKSFKYNFISTDNYPSIAGHLEGGADVLNGYGVDIDNLVPYQATKVAFALVIGSSLEEIKVAAQKARNAYQKWTLRPPSILEKTICSGDDVTLSLSSDYRLYKDPFLDSLISIDGNLSTSSLSADTVFYAIDTTGLYNSDVLSIPVDISRVMATFEFSNDTMLLGGNSNNQVKFMAETKDINKFNWILANGLRSTLPSPFQQFDQEGIYNISLETTDIYGCLDSIKKDLVVANPGSLPIISTIAVCSGKRAEIRANNTNSINIYTDSLRQERLFSGISFLTGNLLTDTAFFITNTAEAIESIPVKASINITKVTAGFEVNPDLDIASPTNSVLYSDKSSGNVTDHQWFLDGQLKGNDAVISIRVSEGSDNLMYIVATENNCRDTLITSVSYQLSSTASQENQLACLGSDFVINPNAGTFFSFYADNQKQTLLHRGESYTIENIAEAQTIYVSNLDKIIESENIEAIDITPVLLPAKIISLPKDTLWLDHFNRTASFSVSNGEVSDYQWIVNGFDMDRTSSPILLFDSAGNYNVQVVVSNAIGCRDTLFKDYHVSVPIRTGNHGLLWDNIEIFPNPFSDLLTVKLNSPTECLLIITNGIGKEVVRRKYTGRNEINLDTRNFPAGMYVITLQLGTQSYIDKFIKQ